MTYRVITDYRAGIPQTPTGTVGPFRMIALHDTEGGVGEKGALGTIQFLIDRKDRNASYHEIWSWEELTKAFTARRIVPPTSAAHSVNPFPPSAGGSYEPDALVRAALGARVNDPNRAIYAVSIAGKVADVDRWSKDPAFVAACMRRIAEIQKELNIPAQRGEHFRFNPSTRSDWGRLLTPALTAQEGHMADIDTFLLESITIDKGAAIRSAPSGTASVLFTTGDTSSAVSVGTKNGFHCYWIIAQKRWGYTSTSANVLSRSPYVNEVVKEVSTGITQAQLDAAVATATTGGIATGISREKSRLRKLLGL